MNWFIASDIHGSALWCRRMLEAASDSGAERLLLLGDLLYHGPRNDIMEDYDPREVIRLLSGWADRILAVRGNCEAEVDQAVLPFPVLAEYAVLPLDDRLIYVTHGHKLESAPLPLRPGDLLLCGHTHVPACEERYGVRYLNPGSVAIPKEGSCHSAMILQDGVFRWIDLATGAAWREYRLTR